MRIPTPGMGQAVEVLLGQFSSGIELAKMLAVTAFYATPPTATVTVRLVSTVGVRSVIWGGKIGVLMF